MHQLAAAAHAVGVVFPGEPAVAHFLDDRGERVALERRHQRAERAGVLGLDLGQGERKARQVVVAGHARLMVGDEQLGDAGVVQDLDPVFAQVALEPGPGDVEPLVQAARVLHLPGRSLARVLAARLADQELGGHLLRGRIGQASAGRIAVRRPATRRPGPRARRTHRRGSAASACGILD